MDLKDITLLIWDDPQNFNLPATQRQLGSGSLYKSVVDFNSKEEFEEKVINNERIKDEDALVFCCHINYADFSGYFDLRNSRIKDTYAIPEVIYLSSGDSAKVMEKLITEHRKKEIVILYNELIDKIKLNEIKSFTKSSINGDGHYVAETDQYFPYQGYPKIDYAIITALYEDEFEEVKKLFDFNEKDIIKTQKKEYHVGYLKSNHEKKVVVAIPSATGMVDSAIIATQMLEFFRPKYLMMSGVCGGKPDLKFGDIVVGSSIYMFQKGKISDINQVDENGKVKKVELYDKQGLLIDYDHLYDKDGTQVVVSVEKFEVELDSKIELHPLLKERIIRKSGIIKDAINEDLRPFDKKINIYVEPIACSTMVINKAGYFEDKIKSIDRKTAAVEMESYGVARACQFANDGKTLPIIFKSVMDNMVDKDDAAKRFAAHTSAQFLKHLFEQEILD